MRRVLEKRVVQGGLGTPFGFTGEQTDANGLLYLRARHYAPSLGIFLSLDPFEGDPSRPMSLNGYMYVEGDPVNMVDPNGENPQLAYWLNSSTCQETRLNPCGGSWLDYADVVECLNNFRGVPHIPDAIRQRYLNASVMISFNDDASCGTEHPITVVPSLGALTNRGLWTHDHHFGAGNLWPQQASNAAEGLTFIKSWRCITFTGFNQSITVQPASIEALDSVTGAMLLSPNVVDCQGNSRSLLDLGSPILQDTYWDPTQDNLVFYAHVKGNNDTLKQHGGFFYHGFIDLMSGEVVASGTLYGRQAYMLEERSEFDYGDVVEGGDSGGGVFANGELVGVNLGRSGDIRDRVTYFNHHFVPITRSVR